MKACYSTNINNEGGTYSITSSGNISKNIYTFFDRTNKIYRNYFF